jgi:hypothetical protein
MAEWRNHLEAQGARPMPSSATATPAVLVITSRLCVQRVDGDQSLCAAGGLGQSDGHDQYIPSMPLPPGRPQAVTCGMVNCSQLLSR